MIGITSPKTMTILTPNSGGGDGSSAYSSSGSTTEVAVNSGRSYRMKALEASSGKIVYWTATNLDITGAQYAGTSSLSKITLFRVI